MSNDPHSARSGVDGLMGLWFDFTSKVMQAAISAAPDAAPPDAFRQVRKAYMDAWETACQQVMRSPEFLDVMQRSLSGAVEARKGLNDAFGQVQQNLQLAGRQDIDYLVAAMRRLEQTVVEQSERTSSRLRDLSARLAELEHALRRARRPGGRRQGSAPPSRRNEGRKRSEE